MQHWLLNSLIFLFFDNSKTTMKLHGVISFVATLIPLLLTFAAYAQTDEPLCYIKTGSGTTFNISC